VGDIAVSSITSIWNQCGFACEVIRQDYGEDLLVQSSHQGSIDYCRIFVQVKGTRNILRFLTEAGKYRIRISFEHAMKWVRSPDLVVLILWDVKKNFGLWAFPEESLFPLDLLMGHSKTVSLDLDESREFNIDQAMTIGWHARIRHCLKSFNHAIAQETDEQLHEVVTQKQLPKRVRHTGLIIYEFLRLIGGIDENGVNREFISQIQRAAGNLKISFPQDSPEKLRGKALLLVLLARVQDRSGSGLPQLFLHRCSEITTQLLTTMKAFDV
jgi:hypothetical protein